ncbi:uncharacterized protein LOC134656257 [Cydia amplana]|uniref:uncharacterized protein LOC134656257 n=1 Tax=Cydia amplana TaxID=1869771 RepID=UPI002FE60CE3
MPRLNTKQHAEVEIPPKFVDFKLEEYRCDETCIIAFCSEEAKKRINTYKIFYGDGTFHSCPSPFQQMYTIHGDVGSTTDSLNIVPLIYVFMTDSTTQSYVTVFNIIKRHLPGFNPSQFMTDYETAAMNAISEVFPQAIVKGCWYHYARAIQRKAKKLRITKRQHDKRIVALTQVLPFLPVDLILEGWEYILDDLYDSDDDEMLEFKTYFEGQWLEPIQFKEKWSVYRELVRTNNCLEGWHSKINGLVGKRKRPSLLKLLSILKNDADYYMIKMKGGLREKRKKNTIKRQEFIEK